MNKIIKRTVSVLLAICLIVPVMSTVTFARSAVKNVTDSDPDGSESFELEKYVDLDELRLALVPHFASCETLIDVSGFKIPVKAADSLNSFIWREIPEAFHVNSLGNANNGTIITQIYSPDYAVSAEEYASMIAECEEAAAKITRGIAGNGALSDVEKALLIHDRLCERCEYNYNFDNYCYTMYGALAKGSAVCDGYTKAYSYLLRLCGIDCRACISSALNHAWNLVKIDGIFYHTDVTWDDLGWGSYMGGISGGVQHTNFLRSNAGIVETKHTADDYYKPVNDGKYDSYFWQDSVTGFQYADGVIYFLDGENNAIRVADEGKTVVTAVGDTWFAGGGSYWVGNFARLGTDGRYLYYSKSSAVYLLDPGTGRSELIYEPELEGTDSIYGFIYEDGYLVIDVNDKPYGSVTRHRRIRVPFERLAPDISAELSSSVDIASSQTVTAEITSSIDVSSYYWGESPSPDGAGFTPYAGTDPVFTVTNPGTYYFIAKDTEGNLSAPVSLTFCLTVLHTAGGDVECDRILSVKGFDFDLPTPEKAGSRFNGWATEEGAGSGEMTVEISDPPLTADYYATWIDPRTVSGRVTTVGGAEAAVTVTFDDGSTLVLKTDGEYAFDTFETHFTVTVSAAGHVSQLFDAGEGVTELPDADLFLSGDVNLDGAVDNRDVVLLFKYVSGGATVVSDDAADIDADNTLTNKDVAVLFKYVSGADVTVPVKTVKMN